MSSDIVILFEVKCWVKDRPAFRLQLKKSLFANFIRTSLQTSFTRKRWFSTWIVRFELCWTLWYILRIIFWRVCVHGCRKAARMAQSQLNLIARSLKGPRNHRFVSSELGRHYFDRNSPGILIWWVWVHGCLNSGEDASSQVNLIFRSLKGPRNQQHGFCARGRSSVCSD